MRASLRPYYRPMSRLAAVAVTVIASTTALAAAVAPAAAETAGKHESAIAWGGTALELSTAGVFLLNFGTDLVPNHGPGMIINFTPMVIGPAVGYGARNADPTPALAVHGGGWLGLDLFLVGTLIDGRADRHRMKVGTAALTLGAVGALAGGYLAATRIDPGSETSLFMGAPPLGFAAGGVFLGGLYVLIGGIDGDKAASQFATGAVAGLTLGLGAATIYAMKDRRDPGVAALAPRIEPSRDQIVFSVGGAF